MALKYKIGDRVRIKSLDWYNENKDKVGNILYKRDGSAYPVFFSKYMSNFCGEILTIKSVFNHSYHMNETSSCEFWIDEMIEGLVEDTITTNEQLFVPSDISLEKEMEWNLPDGYIFKDENGNVINATKIVLEKKKKEYPKTYEECCKVFGLNHYLGISWNSYDVYSGAIDSLSEQIEDIAKKLEVLSKLLLCRAAYWKIAGDEMGLGKPWEPNEADYVTGRYCIFVHRGNIICSTPAEDCPLTFPTEEMRDAFKENFDPDIEICKEFL